MESLIGVHQGVTTSDNILSQEFKFAHNLSLEVYLLVRVIGVEVLGEI